MSAALARLVLRCARPVPVAVLRALGAVAGWVWYRLVPIRRRVARAQVREALGLDAASAEVVVRGMYLHLGRSALELLALERLARDAAVVGEGHLAAALTQGRGVLLLTAHLGNWEVLVRYAASLGRPVSVLTQHLHSPWAEAAWRVFRAGGARLLPATGSARAVRAALGRGEMVGAVLDQHDPSPRAAVLPFFGRPAATATGLARCALSAGAPIVPVFGHRDAAGRHHIEFFPAITRPPGSCPPAIAAGRSAPGGLSAKARRAEVEGLTVACLAAVEAAIRRTPTQWLWIHRRWKVVMGPPELSP